MDETVIGKRRGIIPPFLLLVGINTVFIGMVLWFLDQQLEQRMSVVNRVIDGCTLSGGKTN